MSLDIINKMFENARTRLKTEHDSMIKKIQDDLQNSKKNTVGKVSGMT